jgi:NAD(P)-dependent dehydrogenase (short-subunit alcohol dehydrogenase family)
MGAPSLPDLTGRTYVVTGANSGIGLEAARKLAAAGGHVVLAVRDTAKGDAAAAQLDGSTEVAELDLADLSSVRAFAEAWGEREITSLVNNAGIMMVAQGRTVDGFERQLGTNHLGHFALTNLLLPQVTDRVVTVSSGLHNGPQVDFDDLDLERSYRPTRAYQQSKLANLLFTAELQRRLTDAGSSVVAGRPLAVTADLPPNSYIGPSGFQGLRGAPGSNPRSAQARDADAARRLWEVSEQRTGTSFPL